MQSPRSRQTSVGWVDRAGFRVTRPASNSGLPWRLKEKQSLTNQSLSNLHGPQRMNPDGSGDLPDISWRTVSPTDRSGFVCILFSPSVLGSTAYQRFVSLPSNMKTKPAACWSTHNRVCRDLLVFRASARCRVRLMLETTPRLRLS